MMKGCDRNTAPTVAMVAVVLLDSHTGLLMELLVEPLTFEAWFVRKVWSNSAVRQSGCAPLQWHNLSLIVLREIAATRFSVILPYIHTILHYCVLHLNETVGLGVSHLRGLFDQITAGFPNPLRYGRNTEISFDPKGVSGIHVSKMLSELSEQLLTVYAPAVDSWAHESLQWITGCGELKLAGRSAMVYSIIVKDVTMHHVMPILRSIETAVSALDAGEDRTDENKLVVFDYVQKCLCALKTVMSIAATHDFGSLTDFVFDYVTHFTRCSSVSREVSLAALRIMQILVSSGAVSSTERLMPALIDAGRMLGWAVNDRVVLDFIMAVIQDIESTKLDKVRATALGLALPVLYVVISAHQSIDPYASFVSHETMARVRNFADMLRKLECEGCQEFADIFAEAMDDDKVADDVLYELAAKLWHSYSNELETLGSVYLDICKYGQGPLSSAIFSVARAFMLSSIKDKLGITTVFECLFATAAHHNDPAARDFISVLNRMPVSEELCLTWVDCARPDIEVLIAGLRDEIESYQGIRFSDPNNSSVVTPALSMIPIVGNVWKRHAAEIPFIQSLSLEPFARQLQFWDDLQHMKSPSPSSLALPVLPSAYELYIHANIMPDRDTIALTSSAGDSVDPCSLVVPDEDWDNFESRLSRD